MNKFIIGAFVTKDSPYEKILVDYLIKSIKDIKTKTNKDISFDFIITPNYRSWYRNVAEKPKVILEMLSLAKNKDTCLVFLDADAEVLKYPKLFEEIPEEYDIAFHTLNWNIWYGYKNEPPVKELLTGTMFFRNNPKVQYLCQEWYKEAIKTREWEQKVLQRIIIAHDIKIYELPLEYCYMKSRPGDREPLVKLNPVILHHQASRELKRKLK